MTVYDEFDNPYKIRKNITGLKFGRLSVIRFHSKANKRMKWLCTCECGNEAIIDGSKLRNGHTRSCGCLAIEMAKSRSGSKHNLWRGGIKITDHGYVEVKNRTHPNARKDGYVKEHIMVMSNYLGRPLLKGETVHHKNGVKHDNRLENLELWSRNHSNGQRIADLVKNAEDVIKLYKPFIKTSDMTIKPLVYIAGALRSDIPGYISNLHRMIKSGEEVRRNGMSVFIPGLDVLQGLIMGDMEFEDYFQNSFAILPRCDAIFLTPGWESSKGTAREIAYAKSLGIPVFDDIVELKNHFITNQIDNHNG